jgi:tetratricopeptide (TPR) repeat protein
VKRVKRGTALLAASATVVALAAGALVGGVFAEAPSAGSGAPARSAFAEPALSVAASGVSAMTVAGLEEEVRARPSDASALVQLAFAYQLRWRETGDASFLPRSERALRRALRVRPDDPNAVLGLGALALIRHDFREALLEGRRAQRLLPGSARPYGVVGDALVELGRYRAAFGAFDRMAALRPSLASYARVAYGRELMGNRAGAARAMQLALEAGAGQPEPTAWAHVELAKLAFGQGEVDAARRHARAALLAFPGYPNALVELARVDAAEGQLAAAVRDALQSVDTVPTGASVALLADILERAGRHSEARRQRRLVGVIERLLRANGVSVDLESAVYRADHRIQPLETAALARRARAARPSIYGDDALAWALARAGKCSEALPYADRSLRLGTRDALLYFHRGYIAGCAGNESAMRDWYERALELSPHFSVRWAPVARRILAHA